MKIKTIRAYKKNLALVRPYTIASKTVSDVENVFLEVELENGITGIGSANPVPDVVNENVTEALANLQTEKIQELAGKDIRSFLLWIEEIRRHFPDKPGTQAAVDLALHDVFGKFIGVPVAVFYGQKIQSLPTSVTIGIKDTTATLEEAQEYYDRGFKVLKVKTGLQPDEDMERLFKIREKFGSHFTIRVDANRGYSLEELKTFIQKTQSLEIELIEQPLEVGLEAQLQSLDENARKKLAADESLKNPKIALQLTHPPAPYGIFNIKLMKCGGLCGAFEIATIAKNAGITLFWGCNDESIVSITAALHAAFACAHTRYIDLDGSLDLAEDLVKGGFVLKEGMMSLNPAPGFGYEKR